MNVIHFGGDTLNYLTQLEHALQNSEHVLLQPPQIVFDTAVLIPDLDEPAVGLCSSGTTGDVTVHWIPKSRIIANGKISARKFYFKPNSSVLLIASPWHVAGLTWWLGLVESGCRFTVAIPAVGEQETWNESIVRENYTVLVTVPGAMRLIKQTNPCWKIKDLIVGGARLDETDEAFLSKNFDRVFLGYGQTEAGGLISRSVMNTDNLPEDFIHNCGTPAQGIEIRCKGSKDMPAAIFIKTVYGKFTDWYDSGDIGFIDSTNSLHVTGRSGANGGNCNKLTAITQIAHK